MKKIKLLNGLPLSAIQLTNYQFSSGNWAWLRVAKISSSEALEEIRSHEVESFVGHPATAKLLGVSFNRKEAALLPGDEIIIVTLGRRPQGDEEVTLDDLKFFRVSVPDNQWEHETF